MIRNILIFSLRNRWAVIIAAIVLSGIGYWCFTQLKIEAYPDIADTNVIIVAPYDGRAAEEVEQQVTIPIERALNNVPRVLDRRSRTIFGLSVVQLTFQDGTDDYFARQQVIERLSSITLPDGVIPELAPLTTAVGEIYRYVVEAPASYSPMQLRDLQDWVIRPAILQVPGIADVTNFGGPLKQYHILTAPDKLRKYNLVLQDVMDAVSKNNQNTGGNVIERGGQGFAVRGLGSVKSEKDIQNIVLTAVNGTPVYIRDVATVEITPPPPSGVLGYAVPDAGIDKVGSPEGIILLRRGENPSEVLKALKAKMADIASTSLPEGVTLRVLYDRSFLIDHSLETVSHTLFMGVSIVIIILVFFLGSIRSALVVTATIPFALLFAFILMRLTGIPANLLSLGAIDFGIIVDGACVMAEHLIRRYRNATEAEKKGGIIGITMLAAQEVGREIFFSVTIIILAYTPILMMTRVEGKLFSPMALTLAFAVIGSMICALSLIPVLISFAYKKALSSDKPMKSYRNPVLDFCERAYKNSLNFFLRFHKQTVISAGIFVLLFIALGTKLGTEFLPELDEGSIFMRAFLPAGVTIQDNALIAPKIREIAAKYPPVKYIITQTGRNDDGTDPFPTNRTEILIGLKDYHLWSDTISKKELVRRIQADLERNIPGASFNSGQPIIDQVMEIVTGSAADLAISVVGDDLAMMRVKADSIANIVKATKGSASVNIEQEGTQAQLAININRENAARFGINVSDIQGMIEAAIGGKTIGTLYDGTKRYDIVIRYLPEYRNTPEAIKNLQIPSSTGALIPMEQVADIQFIDGQTNIYRIDGKRMITVRTNVRGRDQGSFVAELQQKINQQVHVPKGYDIIYGGQYENLERAGKQLSLTIPLTIVIVFVFLFMLFKSMKHTFVTMSCILVALAGGIAALFIRGYHFNVSGGVGFVSIFGISVMAGVLLVSALNREMYKSPLTLRASVQKVAVDQFKAIMMMLIVAIIGLVPAALSTGIGSDVQRPLATVIIGGLTFTLLFTPVVIPPLYYWLERKTAHNSHDTTSEQDETL
ncbi:efflux RND transporter permease subunit [Chitinophaga arvensicola]|uniref:Cobalt-zinc-cadmium resistance protein CzcA n=1 Tax=Chitinophaga arvensicola TaxID=29529 RepID=A0A1I0RS68_9BACT|nr:CusA/CzcA family heavy metal efflux RND transporter [Chitinophaga arvensicola]SEW44131.1 cobalt-zinc-cadmium resistance protein CzcA [Chitinophaga arvensicola]